MFTKSIIASLLVLGSLTSVAAAAPCAPTATPISTQQPVYSQPVHAQPVRYQPVAYQPVAYQPVAYQQPTWHHGPVRMPTTLASDIQMDKDGRQFIKVGAQKGEFRTLTIAADGGRTDIKQVYVQFADGREQEVRNVDKQLTNNASLTLDLDGNRPEAIRRIVVYGTENTRHAAFTITAA